MTNPTANQRGQSKNSGAERRRAARLPASAIPDLKSIQLSGTEAEITLVNVSRGGALLEGMTRLAPRSPISIRIVTAGQNLLIRGRVLRSEVCGYSGAKLKYQTALRFDEEFTLIPADLTESVMLPADVVDLQPPPSDPGDLDSAVPTSASEPPPTVVEEAGLEANFTPYCASHEELRHFLHANNW